MAKRETQSEKMEKILKKHLKDIGKTITGCTFVGVQYDAKAVDAIQVIAEGLKSNAESLGKLADVLKASNVELETLLKL